jgi:serine/alanine adding enzyme
MGLELGLCDDAGAWNEFVLGHAEARFCHLFEYGEALTCYGYRPIRLAFRKNGAIVGALPMSAARSLFFGRKLVSQPFSEYGGLLADATLDFGEVREIARLLDGYFRASGKFRVLEMHGNRGVPADLRDELFTPQNRHHTAILSLARPPDEIWKQVVDYSVRKGVNKARKEGLTAIEECSEAVLRERFFPLYLKSMKRLGVPPHPLEYYLRCCRGFGARMKIFWAVKDGAFLAGLLGFTCGNRVNIVNTVSEPEAWKYSPNDLIHWEFINWSCLNGFRYFDFGSVRYDGQRTFKKKWGTVFEDYAYYVICRDPATAAKATFSSSSPSMTRLSKLWSAYVPEGVAQRAGPFARKHLIR